MQDETMSLRDGRTLGFSDYGQPTATPILLFHGTPGSRICGLEDWSLLDQYEIRVIAPERPGYGLSDPNPGRKIIDWAGDMAELADHLGLDKFHIAGESGGGPYVLACAVQMPTRVLSATLIGSACPPEVVRLSKAMAFGNRMGFYLARYAPLLMKLASAMFANAVRKHPDNVMQRLISQLSEWDRNVLEQSGERKRSLLISHFKEAFRQGNYGHFSDSLLIARHWGFDLSEVKIPVFMWHGETDNLMPMTSAKEFSRLIPGCECHFVPGAGHFLLESEDVGSKIVERLLTVNAQQGAPADARKRRG
ncbi:MAG: alpha/beta hydrolase [Gammaproteobacteria bacterium]|nr:alpha/beta hydrolase [Gammaproteobacteria bacterium]MBU1980112.1 alpha/beta hydrolase [Gammaproteobacteria bacterium]